MYLLILFVAGILLFILSVMDLRNKKVNIWAVMLFGIVCVTGLLLNHKINIYSGICGFATGLFAVGFSLISKEQIGIGDGIIIAFMGLLLGFKNGLVIVCMASFFMAIVSLVLIVLKRVKGHTRLPFIPAIFASYCVCMVL